MPLAMSKAVFDSASPLLQQPSHLVDDVRSVLANHGDAWSGSVVSRTRLDCRANVSLPEVAGFTTRGLGGVENVRNGSQQCPYVHPQT